jgi:DNA-binding transcriptional ArsR family regulator
MSRKALSSCAGRKLHAPIFAALGDETRLALVAKLSGGHACSITQLTEDTKLTRQAVTKHLRVLQGARIVRSVRSGRERLFELDPAPIREVKEYADVVCAQWDDALSRLKMFVEG